MSGSIDWWIDYCHRLLSSGTKGMRCLEEAVSERRKCWIVLWDRCGTNRPFRLRRLVYREPGGRRSAAGMCGTAVVTRLQSLHRFVLTRRAANQISAAGSNASRRTEPIGAARCMLRSAASICILQTVGWHDNTSCAGYHLPSAHCDVTAGQSQSKRTVAFSGRNEAVRGCSTPCVGWSLGDSSVISASHELWCDVPARRNSRPLDGVAAETAKGHRTLDLESLKSKGCRVRLSWSSSLSSWIYSRPWTTETYYY